MVRHDVGFGKGNMMRQLALVLTICLLAVGCVTQSPSIEWKRKANAISVGTPRMQIEKALPPASAVIDPRSGQTPGQLAYWVDDNTLVRIWVDADDVLAKPIRVETKKRPKEAIGIGTPLAGSPSHTTECTDHTNRG